MTRKTDNITSSQEFHSREIMPIRMQKSTCYGYSMSDCQFGFLGSSRKSGGTIVEDSLIAGRAGKQAELSSLPQAMLSEERWTMSPGAVTLTDGGIETRLIYEFGCELPEFASFLALFEREGRAALTAIYRS
jgi:hypothetical protein